MLAVPTDVQAMAWFAVGQGGGLSLEGSLWMAVHCSECVCVCRRGDFSTVLVPRRHNNNNNR